MTRRNPFEELEELFERMSSQFEGGDWYRVGGRPVAVDLVDAGESYELTADLPGYDREEIDLTMTDGTLRIEAEREETTEDFEEDFESRYVRRERREESVSRTVQLPEPIDEESAEARYSNGVLTITLPKVRPDEHGTHINIE